MIYKIHAIRDNTATAVQPDPIAEADTLLAARAMAKELAGAYQYGVAMVDAYGMIDFGAGFGVPIPTDPDE